MSSTLLRLDSACLQQIPKQKQCQIFSLILMQICQPVAEDVQGLAEPSPKLVTAQSRYELMALQSFLVLQQSAPLFSQ